MKHNHDQPTDESKEATPIASDEDNNADATASPVTTKDKLKSAHQNIWQWILTHKKISIPAAVVLALAVVSIVPFTRYLLASTVISKDFAVIVVDSQTNKPVTSATVDLDGKRTTTNNKGIATVHAPVGSAGLSVSKTYYKSVSKQAFVPIGKQKQPEQIRLVATGRQVPVKVTNKLSGKAVANAQVVVGDAQIKTDQKGEAIIVVPAAATELEAAVTLNGYNELKAKIKVTTAVDPANTFAITPTGKLYFLSNQSGKLDIVKSNLDGTDRKIVVAGTGKEDKNNTVLLASRDWRHIALLSKRDGGDNAKLFLLETGDDQLITMDEGDADFRPLGWSGDRFIYSVTRTKLKEWQPKRQSLKSYQASTKKITALDETTAEGVEGNYATETLGDAFIYDQEVVYVKNSYFIGSYTPKWPTFNSVQSDGSQKKTVKTYENVGAYYLTTQPGEFNELYIQYYSKSENKNKYDAYHDGKLAAEEMTDAEFYSGEYHTYIVSPSGQKTFWSEFRDGKYVFFVGDAHGENGKQLTGGQNTDEYAAYGWYSDDYLLVTKKGSEMRIMPVGGLDGGVEASQKVGDYFKPGYLIRGYGYGYGG